MRMRMRQSRRGVVAGGAVGEEAVLEEAGQEALNNVLLALGRVLAALQVAVAAVVAVVAVRVAVHGVATAHSRQACPSEDARPF